LRHAKAAPLRFREMQRFLSLRDMAKQTPRRDCAAPHATSASFWLKFMMTRAFVIAALMKGNVFN
jgi:hypothetical protein